MEDRRRSRRRPIPGVLINIEAPQVSSDLRWAGTAIDINGDGVGLAILPEVPTGMDVLLSFQLEGMEFQHVRGIVERTDELLGVGAVRFEPWDDDDRLSLVTFLIEH